MNIVLGFKSYYANMSIKGEKIRTLETTEAKSDIKYRAQFEVSNQLLEKLGKPGVARILVEVL